MARALVPIALGHALSIGSVVLAAAFLGMALPPEAIRYSVAALLFGLGVFSLVRHHHPRWVRMQVGFRDLTRLVVSDGIGARCRFNVAAGVAGQPHSRSG